MNSKTTKRILREIAEEEDLPVWVVEKIVKFEFYATQTVMGLGTPGDPETFLKISLLNMGMWHPNDKRIEVSDPNISDKYEQRERNKVSDEERYFAEL